MSGKSVPKKGYKKLPWLFQKEIEIPEEWDVVSLDSVITKNNSTIEPIKFPKENFELYSIPSYHESGNPEIIQGEDIHSNKILVDNDMVLFGKINPNLPKIWYVISDTKLRKIGSTEFIQLKGNTKTSSKFLFYLSWSKFLYGKCKSFVSGTTPSRERIEPKPFLKIKIPLPPLTEQQKIASILSNVDNLIQNTDKLIEKTTRLKKGLMQELLTRGIGHTKFKKVPWLFGKEIEIPEEWERSKLIEKCVNKPEYGANTSAIKKDLKLPRYIRITDLNDDGTLRDLEWKSISEEDAKDYILNENDFLFARTGATVGKTFLYQKNNGRCAYAGYLIRFKPDSKNLNPRFLFELTHSKLYWIWLLSIQTWGVQPNVNAEQYSNMPLLLPPLPEQQKIASILSNTDEKIQSYKQYKEKLQRLKKSLMQKLLTGEVRVAV